MYLSIRYFCLFIPLLLFISCAQITQESAEVWISPEELSQELEDGILHQWFPRVMDSSQGGYLSNFSYNWNLEDNQNKMIVTQARHLWMSSIAAMHFPDDPRYKKTADHGFPFVSETLWDTLFGGFYQYVDRSGKPLDGDGYFGGKRAYGMAFGIYGLAAYYRLTQNPAALARALEAFHWLETHAHDPEFGGYFDILSKEGIPLLPASTPDWTPASHIGLKDYNSSIHLMEAFAELYRAKPDTLVGKRLEEMLVLVRDTFTQEEGYMQLYFTPEWEAISYQDSSQLVREQNYGTDHVSPGHDIETAFLLLDAEEALGRPSYEKTLAVARKMVDHTLDTGFDTVSGGFYEQLYYLPGQKRPTLIDGRKNWWAQAEGLHTLIMFATLFPEEERYKQAAALEWAYIKAHIIDPTHKGWYSYGIDTDPTQASKGKGNVWKSAYHNGRALLESLALLGSTHSSER